MHICRVTSVYPPPWAGLAPGPYGLTAAQVVAGDTVTVVARQRAQPDDSLYASPVHWIRCRHDLTFALRAVAVIRERHARAPFDVIHAHGFSGLGVIAARRLGRLDIPVVTTMHVARAAQRGDAWIRDRWTLLQERVAYRYSDGVCAVSPGVARALEEHYGKRRPRAVVVWNGVDTERFRPTRESRPFGATVSFLFVGVLNGRKGEIETFQALGDLVRQGLDFRLSVVGDGPNAGTLRSMADAGGFSERITYLPYVDFAQMPELYRSADVLLLPSHSEGMPKVLLEALSSGLPVIASAIPGCIEVIEPGVNGLLVAPGNVAQLAEAMADLCRNSALVERMSQHARRAVEERFSWACVAQRVRAAYDEVLPGSVRPTP